MKILVTGVNGLLGQHLVPVLLEKQYRVVGIGRGTARIDYPASAGFTYYEADISGEQPLHDIMYEERPDVVVHGAAMTQVDECELNQDRCFDINVHGTMHALVDAEQFSSLFIYISTDFVFSGEEGNYREEDPPRPVNWYGYTKTEAEALVEASDVPWAIVRTCLVYGRSGKGTRNNMITWSKQKLEKNKPFQVVDDQVRTPTYAGDLANGILLIIEKKATGIFHLSGKDIMTPFDMTLATARHFGLDASVIERVNAGSFSQPAKRPARTGFIIDKAINELGYSPLSFDEGLRKMFEQ